jgi:iron complex transport system permease protein
MLRKNNYLWVYGLSLPVLLGSLFIGPSGQLDAEDVLALLSGRGDRITSTARSILFDIRLPRVLLVFMTGSTLAVTGSVLQAIFRNPLVDPYILGLSSGAAFGAALGLVTALVPVPVSAFVFGLTAVGLAYFMARRNKQVSIVSLILAGVITNGIFTALLTILQIVSDPFTLQRIVHWLMGNFQNASWTSLQMTVFPVLLGMVVLFFFRWRLNLIALGDEEAAVSGIRVDRLKLWLLLAATLAGSAAVAVSGVIGLYGLVIPHVVRMLFGVDNKATLVLNLLIGGCFLVIIDTVSRSFGGFEVPIGVFTMLIGAPFFIFLLKKSNVGWQH